MDIYHELTLGRRVRWNGRALVEGVVMARRAEIGPYEGNPDGYQMLGDRQSFPQIVVGQKNSYDELEGVVHLNGNDILSNKLTLL